MKPNGIHDDDPADVMALLIRREEDAQVTEFVNLCRRSPFLRRWLWSDFAQFERVRTGLKRIVEEDASGVPPDAGTLRQLSSGGDLLAAATRQIRKRIGAGAIYGGLSWTEVEALVRRYHAGTLDVGAFLLVHDWRASPAGGGASSRLSTAAVAVLDAVILRRDKRLLRHVLKAVDFLDEFGGTQSRRAALGHVNWWKVSVLLYLLNHPKPAYRTRELRAHLAAQGLDIETKDIRRFCSRHGIRRDSRAGRPVGEGR